MRFVAELAAAFAPIAFLTLTPSSVPPSPVSAFCLLCGELGAPDLIVNVLLFVPLGIVLARGGVTPLLALGAGLLLSGGIELAQIGIPGRSPTLRDVLVNGTGCGLGALVATSLRQWLTPSPLATALWWAAMAGVPVAVALTGWLLRFEPLADRPHYVNWVPRHGHLEPWLGSVREFRVGGVSYRPQRLGDPAPLVAGLRDSVQVDLSALAGPPTERLGGIVRITTDRAEEALLVGLRGDDFVVHVRRLAADWRLDAPGFRFPGALAGLAPGDSIHIQFAGAKTGGCATVNGSTTCIGKQAAGSVWRLARAFDYLTARSTRALDGVALLFLAFPAGLLLRSVPRAHQVLGVTALVATVHLAAWTGGLALPGVGEWLGGALAFVFGAALHGRIRATDRTVSRHQEATATRGSAR